MRQDYTRFADRHTAIVSAGTENPDEFQKYWQKNELPFIGIPDPDQKVLKLYGQEVNMLKLGRMPAQFLIDSQGNLEIAHYSESMKDIIGNDQVLKRLDQMMNETL